MKRATLLFSDLINFTGLVEKNHPKHVVKIMNQYFNEMTLAIKEHKGLILQYVGDEIEAAFGSTQLMSYELVGDTVNSASRIEGLTKEYGCDIILSQTTYNLLIGSYNTVQLAPVKVKGKKDELIV